MAEMTIRVSDLSGEQGAETFTYEVDGVKYAIDLTGPEAETVRAQFASLIEKSKRIGGRRPATKSGSQSQTAAIREWAIQAGIEVPKKGRVAQEVKDAYHAAQKESGE